MVAANKRPNGMHHCPAGNNVTRDHSRIWLCFRFLGYNGCGVDRRNNLPKSDSSVSALLGGVH